MAFVRLRPSLSTVGGGPAARDHARVRWMPRAPANPRRAARLVYPRRAAAGVRKGLALGRRVAQLPGPTDASGEHLYLHLAGGGYAAVTRNARHLADMDG